MRARLLIGLAILLALHVSRGTLAAQNVRTVELPEEQTRPLLVSGAPPQYPMISRAARVEGIVSVRTTIGPTGTAEAAEVAVGHPMLDQAALEADELRGMYAFRARFPARSQEVSTERLRTVRLEYAAVLDQLGKTKDAQKMRDEAANLK